MIRFERIVKELAQFFGISHFQSEFEFFLPGREPSASMCCMIGLALILRDHRRRLRLWKRQSGLADAVLFLADLQLGVGENVEVIVADVLSKFSPREVLNAEAALVGVMKREKTAAQRDGGANVYRVDEESAEASVRNILRLLRVIRVSARDYYRHVQISVDSGQASRFLEPERDQQEDASNR